jgi:hypothetical protein
VDCAKPANDWSQRKDTSGKSPKDYEPRCDHCHHIYDGIGRKLSPEDVLEIREMLKTGRTHADIAYIFEVSPKTITAIKNGRNWAWLM